MRQLGYAGKTPHRGDFVRHNVPTLVHAVWDDWLSGLLQDAAARLEDWATGYDAAPVWRFALSPDIAGEDARAGVLIASRDGVGRRYPFTVFATLDVGTTPLDALVDDTRIAPLEALAREALADAARYDGLKGALETLQLGMPPPADPAIAPFRAGTGTPVEEPAVFCEDAMLLSDREGTRRLLDAVLRQSTGPYSVWQRCDTPLENGRLLVTGGLPLGDAAFALLGAEWPSSAGGRLDGCRRTDTWRPASDGIGVARAPDADPTRETGELDDTVPRTAVTDPTALPEPGSPPGPPRQDDETPTVHSPLSPEQTPTVHSPLSPEQTPTVRSPLSPERTPTTRSPLSTERTPTVRSTPSPEQTPTVRSPLSPEQTPTVRSTPSPERKPTVRSPLSPAETPTTRSIRAVDDDPTRRTIPRSDETPDMPLAPPLAPPVAPSVAPIEPLVAETLDIDDEDEDGGDAPWDPT